MSHTKYLLPLALLLAHAACGGDDTNYRDCASNSDCLQATISGTCLPSPVSDSKWCAFPDRDCPSGDKWGLQSGDSLASTCVAAVAADAGTEDAAVSDASSVDATVPVDAGTPDAQIMPPDAGPAKHYDLVHVSLLNTPTGASSTDLADDHIWIVNTGDTYLDLSTATVSIAATTAPVGTSTQVNWAPPSVELWPNSRWGKGSQRNFARFMQLSGESVTPGDGMVWTVDIAGLPASYEPFDITVRVEIEGVPAYYTVTFDDAAIDNIEFAGAARTSSE